MNTEKLEKLKKSLDNKFIPDNVKDKIRAEIKKLEADIKTDETITATEVKEEVKEIEKKVEKALEVAEEKEEKAQEKKAKTPARRTTRKTTTSRTKTTKVEPKAKSTKKSVFSVAKQIRKDGESWEQAKERARKTMKSETTETKKKTKTETQKLLAFIKRKKELDGLSGTSIKKDSKVEALPKGRRVSKKGWKNQYGESEGGKVYYENRDNRTDRLAPNFSDKIYLANGGAIIGTPETPLARDLGIDYTGLVGETGAMSSGELFMSGGSVDSKFDLAGFKRVGMFDTLEEAKTFADIERKQNSNFDAVVIKDNERTSQPFIVFSKLKKGKYIGNRVYEMGGNTILPAGAEQHFVNYYLGEGAVQGIYANGGRTNERRHVNKSEDYEVRYAKPRPNRKGYKGVRNFGNGGGIGDNAPQIYVADLEAYNNGKLVGQWFNLLDYNDADELMEAIQDMLKESGGEEYAVHDYENLPSSMYSEYMGVRDFEEIYQMIDLAKDKDLPLEVVMEVVNDYGENAVDEYYGVYDSEEDFAEQLVDDIGIQSFNNFEYYLEITDTDRRLMAQDMADSYVDDIRDEDGGNRLIEEAGLDVDEYEEADSDRQEEMLDEAREIVYDQYYDTWYEGLDDPYYFLVEEQGIYSPEDFANASFVRVDTEKLARDLEQDYTFVRHDGQVYVFSVR